jgi:hypothetical protein
MVDVFLGSKTPEKACEALNKYYEKNVWNKK